MESTLKSRYDWNGLIQEIKYETEEMTLTISEIESSFVVNSRKSNSNLGYELENYRKKKKNMKDEETINSETTDSFFNSYNPDKKNFEYVQIIPSSDPKINSIIERFGKKHFDGKNDYSDSFTKIKSESSTSQKNCDEVAKLFEFSAPDDISTPIKSLLIVDDTIDKGCTIKTLLDLMAESGIVDETTKIEVRLIYNHFRSAGWK